MIIKLLNNYLLLILIVILLTETKSSKSTFSKSGARSRFEKKFEQTCNKYPFVQQYYESLKNPYDEYTIFVFHEDKQYLGGLGDRFGGLINAMAFSLRTKRRLLISGDKSFEESFQPYHPDPSKINDLSWKDWDWSGWKRDYSNNMTFMRHCINPKPSATICSLEHNFPTKVVKLRQNRAYLCRWAVKPSVKKLNLLGELGVNGETADLFEVAGCMLRLALWPTETLWRVLDDLMQPQFDQMTTSQLSYQVGIHYRCGDSSFEKNNDVNRKPNPQCYYDSKIPWKGTTFMDDVSMDSPMDAAICGKKMLNSITSNDQSSILTYIASDNIDSSKQIGDTLKWPLTMRPGGACHVDGGSTQCLLSTAAQWLMLSLSDRIIMQALIKTDIATVWGFEDVTSPPRHLIQQAPISAFSRFAAIYALDPDVISYGISCNKVNKTILSRQTQGNWICDPKRFY
jgi:hypothetical protein